MTPLFGLIDIVFGRSAWELAERAETRGVVISRWANHRRFGMPFVRVQMSGRGREGLGYALEEPSRKMMAVLRGFRGVPGGGEA